DTADRGSAAKSLADAYEQPVALSVTEPVVHGLEVVDVEVQHRRRQRPARRARQGMRESIPEQRAIREPGQDVMEGLMSKLLLERLPLGDVAVVDDHATDGWVVEQVLGDRLEHPERSVVVAGAGPRHPRSPRRARVPVLPALAL